MQPNAISETTDTAPIRLGEELNLQALEDYLREHLRELIPGEPLDHARIEVEQFPGGHSNLTYLVKLGGHEFVLRRPPFGPVAPTAHDMPREYRLLRAVHPLFQLAPQPYLLCEDSSVIGVPFYLMERRRGLVVRRDTPKCWAIHFVLRLITASAGFTGLPMLLITLRNLMTGHLPAEPCQRL